MYNKIVFNFTARSAPDDHQLDHKVAEIRYKTNPL